MSRITAHSYEIEIQGEAGKQRKPSVHNESFVIRWLFKFCRRGSGTPMCRLRCFRHSGSAIFRHYGSQVPPYALFDACPWNVSSQCSSAHRCAQADFFLIMNRFHEIIISPISWILKYDIYLIDLHYPKIINRNTFKRNKTIQIRIPSVSVLNGQKMLNSSYDRYPLSHTA